MKIPKNVLKAVYLDRHAQENEEARNYFLNLFKSINSITFYRQYIVFKGEKSSNKVRDILPASPADGYYATQFYSQFNSCKYFMEKFDLRLYESNLNGDFIYCLTKESPLENFPFESENIWYMTDTRKLTFKKVDEISYDINGQYICYDKELSKFSITTETDNKNLKIFNKFYFIFNILREGAGEDPKYISIYTNLLREKIEEIFNNSNKDNPCVAIAFSINDGNFPKMIEWDYEKDKAPFFKEPTTFNIYFKKAKPNNISKEYIPGCTNILKKINISSYLAFSNSFICYYLKEKMRNDLGIEHLSNPYNIITKYNFLISNM